jgi:hypothetical protein
MTTRGEWGAAWGRDPWWRRAAVAWGGMVGVLVGLAMSRMAGERRGDR